MDGAVDVAMFVGVSDPNRKPKMSGRVLKSRTSRRTTYVACPCCASTEPAAAERGDWARYPRRTPGTPPPLAWSPYVRPTC
eukprot:scaffold434_cov186-Pinguiococcus_pyrenoidosus.AAC.97